MRTNVSLLFGPRAKSEKNLCPAAGDPSADDLLALRADIDGIESDLTADSPGLAERLTALWKKLGREPSRDDGGETRP